ncbi:invasin [Yersinia bercovieri]|uniref:inverse autotransporter beta domain-containing protein n=1 Tax=Yersinia bercovieri TaxID=634 RepID=UPI00061C4AE5|nr:inverse autotransporter beta domain-containing protein [Yersinia bercovieri]CNF70240.1 invasin [Yersinia bercovieri]
MSTSTKPYRVKVITWGTIAAHLSLPLTLAFTPANANMLPRTSQQGDERLAALPTMPYVLKPGETVDMVAKQHNLTLVQLKKINQLRTFSKPFAKLQAGDELEIPQARSNLGLAPENTALTDTQTTERNLAKAATTSAQMLNSGDKAAARQLRGLAVGNANQAANSWLNNFGTARLQANVDDHGDLDGSQFDMLMPFYDTPSQMAFTQFGIRRIDKRTTANLGIGIRHFIDDWMVGYNLFLDRDITRDHTRVGAGAEYARDYLKLAANGYLRLSDWRDSPDFSSYSERPATGFDLRAEAYLPSLPQLGGKLMYEQYFGNDVGLFGKDNRQQNPAAITAGINYTPIPLVTVGIDRKQGSAGNGETLFNLGVNYEVGTPWAKQISPDAVNARRTLQGSRNDLVERNNQIVLEYKKQDVINLYVSNNVSGRAAETKQLVVSVTSKYGLRNIQFDQGALAAAGGKIIPQGPSQFALQLPPQPSGGNNWTISAIASDVKGNTSNRAVTLVQLQDTPATISGTWTPAASTKPADGNSAVLLTLTLKDAAGNPLTGQANNITLKKNTLGGSGSEPTLSALTETGPGIYQTTATAGTNFGVLTLTPEIQGTQLAPATITYTDPSSTKPSVSNLILLGELAEDSKLSATYSFTQPAGGPAATDASTYQWGEKGATAANVANGSAVATSGQVPEYLLKSTDVGKVMEISVQAKNNLAVTGNTLTVDSASADTNTNKTTGGEQGKVTGSTVVTTLETVTDANSMKVGETINLTVTALNKNNLPVSGATIKVQAVSASSRNGQAETATLQVNGKPLTDDVTTDGDGKVQVALTDPTGIGLKTTLTSSTNGSSGTPVSKNNDVIFTVFTSPDSPVADYWGHMDETIIVDGVIIKRPKLAAEVAGSQQIDMNNEEWAYANFTNASAHCTLPTKEDLVALYNAYPTGSITNAHGWPSESNILYWSGTTEGSTVWATDMTLGRTVLITKEKIQLVTCL